MKHIKQAGLAVCLAVLVTVVAAMAQEPAGTREVAVESKDPNVTLMGLWNTGGPFMYPIALLSIGVMALIIYGFINYREKKMLQVELYPGLQQAIRNLDFESASRICATHPSVMTNIMNGGMARLDEHTVDMSSVEKAMEEAAIEENTIGLKPINYISVIASIAPMLGLLGTVSGMIKAFQKIQMGMMGEPEKLAGNIGEAMITTAFGLLVGIPAMFFYFFLKGKFTGNMAKIGRLLGNLTHEMHVTFMRAHEAGEDGLADYKPPLPMDLELAPMVEDEPEAEEEVSKED